jgi:hypothetical protein
MWEQFLSASGIRAVTAARATTIKAPSEYRSGMDPAARRAEMGAWWERLHQPGFVDWWDAAVLDALRRSAIDTYMARFVLREQVEQLEADLALARTELGAAQEQAARLDAESRAARHAAVIAEAELAGMRATRTWRLHDRLAEYGLLRRVLARRPT